MKLDEQGHIIEPKVGDAELVRMHFDNASAILHFKLCLPEQLFRLKLHSVIWLSFSTNFTQNVVSSVRITTNTDAVEVPKCIRDLLLRRTLRTLSDTWELEPLFVVQIDPAAGPKMVCIARKVEPLDESALRLLPHHELLTIECYIIQRREEGGWRVIQRRADLTDIPIADFVSLGDAEDWVAWKGCPPPQSW